MRLTDLQRQGIVPVWTGEALLRPLCEYTQQGGGSGGPSVTDIVTRVTRTTRTADPGVLTDPRGGAGRIAFGRGR